MSTNIWKLVACFTTKWSRVHRTAVSARCYSPGPARCLYHRSRIARRTPSSSSQALHRALLSGHAGPGLQVLPWHHPFHLHQEVLWDREVLGAQYSLICPVHLGLHHDRLVRHGLVTRGYQAPHACRGCHRNNREQSAWLMQERQKESLDNIELLFSFVCNVNLHLTPLSSKPLRSLIVPLRLTF